MGEIDRALEAGTKRAIAFYALIAGSSVLIVLFLVIGFIYRQPTKVETVSVDKIVYIKVPWVDIYNACQGDWSVDGDGKKDSLKEGRDVRTERIRLCGQIANEAAEKGFSN